MQREGEVDCDMDVMCTGGAVAAECGSQLLRCSWWRWLAAGEGCSAWTQLAPGRECNGWRELETGRRCR